MIYLDANVFVYASTDTNIKGDRCRALIQSVEENREKGATCSLTFDEVFWGVKRRRGVQEALRAAKTLLEMPHLLLLDATPSVMWEAYRLIEKHGLDPRDAIHAASALLHGIKTVVSDDRDMDKITGLKRKEV